MSKLRQLIRECREISFQLHKRELLSVQGHEWWSWSDFPASIDEATHFSFNMASTCAYGLAGIVAESNLHSLRKYLNNNGVMSLDRYGHFATQWLCISFNQHDEDNATDVIENVINSLRHWPIFNDDDYNERVHKAKSEACDYFMKTDCPEDLLDFEEEASHFIMEHATEQDDGEYWINPDDVIEHLRGLQCPE